MSSPSEEQQTLCFNLISFIFYLFSSYIELLNMTGIQRRHKEAGRFGSINI